MSGVRPMYCTGGKRTLVKYTLQGMSNKILTARYQTRLPSSKLLTQEIEKTKRQLALRRAQIGLSDFAKNQSQRKVKDSKPMNKKSRGNIILKKINKKSTPSSRKKLQSVKKRKT